MKKCNLLYALIVSCSLSACNSGASGASANQNSPVNTSISSDKNRVSLGEEVNGFTGFPSVNNWVVPAMPMYKNSALPIANDSCLNFNVSETNPISNKIEFSQQITETQIEEATGVSVSVSGGWGAFSSSSSNQFAQSVKKTSNELSYTYAEEMAGTVTINIDESNPFSTTGLLALQRAYNGSDPQIFYNSCGDSYVSRASTAATFLFNIKIKFSTAEEAEDFKTENNLSAGSFASVEQALENSKSSSKKFGSVTVSAFQLGGDVTQLSELFDGKSGDHPVVSCDASNMSACKEILDGALGYADKFGKSVSAGKSTVIINPEISDYQSIQIPETIANADKLQDYLTHNLGLVTPIDKLSDAQYILDQLQKKLDYYDLSLSYYSVDDPELMRNLDEDYANFIESAARIVKQTKEQVNQKAYECFEFNTTANKICINDVNQLNNQYNNMSVLVKGKSYPLQEALTKNFNAWFYSENNGSNSYWSRFVMVPIGFFDDTRKTQDYFPAEVEGNSYVPSKGRVTVTFNNSNQLGSASDPLSSVFYNNDSSTCIGYDNSIDKGIYLTNDSGCSVPNSRVNNFQGELDRIN